MLQSPEIRRRVEKSTYRPDSQEYQYDVKLENPDCYKTAQDILLSFESEWNPKTLKTINADERVLAVILEAFPEKIDVDDCERASSTDIVKPRNWARNTLNRLQNIGLLQSSCEPGFRSYWWLDLAKLRDSEAGKKFLESIKNLPQPPVSEVAE